MRQCATRSTCWLAAGVIIGGLLTAALTARRSLSYAVEGDSMRPTLAPRDYVHAWPWPQPLPLPHGALVVAMRPDQPALAVIKRVVGVEADGALWLRGDNPAASTDSRHFGAVPRARLQGLVWLRYWPPRRLRLLLPGRPPGEGGTGLAGPQARPPRRGSPPGDRRGHPPDGIGPKALEARRRP